MIRLIDLEKVYIDKHNSCYALNKINVNINDKGLVFIVGKSGSGKSTLLNLLGGIDTPTSGSIIVGGEDISKYNKKQLDDYRNNKVSFVFQSYNLIESLSVEDNIILSSYVQGEKKDSNALNRLETVLEKVDLKGLNKKNVGDLSGGQRQRVAIARALIKKTEVILADEPTGALDAKTGESIMNLLKDISKERLVIVVSHDLDFAKRFGDRIIELSDGKIINDSNKDIVNEDSNIKESKERKSKIPFLLNLKLAFSSFKNKALKLFFLFLLSSISLGFFGTSSSLFLFDENYTINKVLANSDMDCITVRKDIEKDVYNYKLRADGTIDNKTLSKGIEKCSTLITKDELNNMNRHGMEFAGIFSLNKNRFFSDYMPIDNRCSLILEKDNLSDYYSVFRYGFIGFTDCGKEYVERHFNIIQGVYPTNYNEIAISKEYASFLYLVDNSTDVLNRKVKFDNECGLDGEFTITGIIDTGDVPNKYEKMKTDDYSSEEYEEWNEYYRESFISVAFVSNDFYEKNNGKYGYDYDFNESYNLNENISYNFFIELPGDRVYTDDILDKCDIYDLNLNQISGKDIGKGGILLDGSKGKEILLHKYYALLDICNEIKKSYRLPSDRLYRYDREIYHLIEELDFIQELNDFNQTINNSKFYSSREELDKFYNKYANIIQGKYDTLLNRRKIYQMIFTTGKSKEYFNYPISERLDEQDRNKILQLLDEESYMDEESFVSFSDEKWDYLYSFITGDYKNTMQAYFDISDFSINYDAPLPDRINEIIEKYGSSYEVRLKGINNQLLEDEENEIIEYVKSNFRPITYDFVEENHDFNENLSLDISIEGLNENIFIAGFIDNHNLSGVYLPRDIIERLNVTFDNKINYTYKKTDYKYSKDGMYYKGIYKGDFTKERCSSVNKKGDNYNFKIDNTNADVALYSVHGFTESISTFFIIGGVIGIFAILLIYNYISSSIESKKNNFGILKSLGARDSVISKICLIEASIVSLIVLIGSTILSIIFVGVLNFLMNPKSPILEFGIPNFLILMGTTIIIIIGTSIFPILRFRKKTTHSLMKSL